MIVLALSLFFITLAVMLVGLARPQWLTKVLGRPLPRRLVWAVGGTFSLLWLLLFVASLLFTPAVTPEDTALTYTVTRVVDGDTIVVARNDTTETVRLIGIDAPETVHPQQPLECYGLEATARAEELLLGQTVRLVADPTQDNRDRFGRLLRYAYLENGTNVNKLLVAEGYAYEFTFATPYRYQLEFRAAEEDAQETGAGLWAPETCGGERELQPAPSVPVAGEVKLSDSGICHAPGTTFYERTLNFTAFANLEECLAAGGRLPLR